MMKRILIVGEHELLCMGLKAVFADRTFTIVTAEDFNEGVRQLAAHSPDLLVFDPFVGGAEGRTHLLKLRQRFPGIPMLVLTESNNPVDIQHVLQQRVSGYVLKSAEVRDLMSAVDTILSGRTYFHPDVIHALFSHRDTVHPKDKELTVRQEEVLRLVAEGRTAKQIASILGVTQKTVESHRVALMTRLGIHNTVGLVRYAILNGYVKLEETGTAIPRKVSNL